MVAMVSSMWNFAACHYFEIRHHKIFSRGWFNAFGAHTVSECTPCFLYVASARVWDKGNHNPAEDNIKGHIGTQS
jgi:hypothetical protein